eukprot:CAMPEP_0195518342 /NCGR_PEP_ID=MMETSP0794_2-20130614/12689_1 /TAXON_ID=515487 /ORGANISM="Stephanopyxis turris, Strain CCMP 815" /LENGTH=433 /DNA_ID=CAMNT_0040647287 /DNA_START=112 /DNA_END=1413 /DNA_ORIENTATION=+
MTGICKWLLLSSCILGHVESFTPSIHHPPAAAAAARSLFPRRTNRNRIRALHSTSDPEEESARLKRKADRIREEIRSLEKALGDKPIRRPAPVPQPKKAPEAANPLKNKTVLVTGANGRLGSMVCRYLLRNYPDTEVVAAVHYVGEATTRGYGRLSYEVGAEDGVGQIGAIWSSDEEPGGYNAYFEATEEMKSYNLQNLRVVEVELLDPIQCGTITEGVDSVIYCATDFNDNKPRAVSGLNAAFLFRAIAAPDKGRVDVEGVMNVLGGLKNAKQGKSWERRNNAMANAASMAAAAGEEEIRRASGANMLDGPDDPTSFVLVSSSAQSFKDFETPFGSFHGIKREGERITEFDFPSLSHSILQMSRFDDNFVQEDLNVNTAPPIQFNGEEDQDRVLEMTKRRINRRDAARAAVDALVDSSLKGKTVQVWTDTRG